MELIVGGLVIVVVMQQWTIAQLTRGLVGKIAPKPTTQAEAKPPAAAFYAGLHGVAPGEKAR